MELLACHIENFGKLSNFTLKFSSGINVINEPNAWGKSTLAGFLKAMFYGLDAKKDAKAFQKERTLYRPWQGGIFGGQVDFLTNGKAYRIVRTFGHTEKTDTFHLYDLSKNVEVNDYSSDIGTELFDLDSVSFKRSIYIAQNDCSSGTSDAINAKLGNLAENTDDVNNYENANKYLKELLNALTPEQVIGSINKRKNYITQLTQELEAFTFAKEELNTTNAKLEEISLEIAEVIQARKNYTDALVQVIENHKKQALLEQYQMLCQDAEAKEQILQEFQEVFPVCVPSDMEFAQQLQNMHQMAGIKALLKKSELSEEEQKQYDKCLEMFENGIPSEQEMEELFAKLSEADKQKEELVAQEARLRIYEEELGKTWMPSKEQTSTGYRVPIVIGVGILLFGAVTISVSLLNVVKQINPEYFLIGGSIAAVCGTMMSAIGLHMRNKKRKEQEASKKAWEENLKQNVKDLSEQIQEIKECLQNIHNAVGQFLENCKMEHEVTEYYEQLYYLKNQLQEYIRLTEQIEENEMMHEEYEGFRKQVSSFIEVFSFSITEEDSIKLTELQRKAMEYRMAKLAFEEAVSKKETFEQTQEKSFWTKEALCPYSLEELNDMIHQADEKLDSLQLLKLQYCKQIEELQKQLDLQDEKSIEMQELLKVQEQETEKYRLVKITQEFLQKAKEQFTAKYMKPISNGFAKYYELLTMDTEENWVVDANVTLKVKEQGELRDVGWLSAGHQDLIGICMRLALVEVMYKGEKPFLILDDPFVNLDKQKVIRGNNLLVNVAKEYQIIYFTCHDSRSPV